MSQAPLFHAETAAERAKQICEALHARTVAYLVKNFTYLHPRKHEICVCVEVEKALKGEKIE